MRRIVMTVLSLALLTAGCAPSPAPAPAAHTAQPTESAAAARDLAGRTIALDPGHNGGNAKALSTINRQVDNGRGGTKKCNTTGTATDDGFTEHEFNWEVVTRAKKLLEDRGAAVILSRPNDTGVGPCVNVRGRFADRADVLISIHANGSPPTKPYGFGAAIAPDRRPKESRQLAAAIVAALKDAEFRPNPSYGRSSIKPRTDLAGLNHARVPAVLMELGEMRNPAEARLMKTARGQQRYAQAVAEGIADYLTAHPAD